MFGCAQKQFIMSNWVGRKNGEAADYGPAKLGAKLKYAKAGDTPIPQDFFRFSAVAEHTHVKKPACAGFVCHASIKSGRMSATEDYQ